MDPEVFSNIPNSQFFPLNQRATPFSPQEPAKTNHGGNEIIILQSIANYVNSLVKFILFL